MDQLVCPETSASPIIGLNTLVTNRQAGWELTMTRFFLHLHECGSVTTDEEGEEFASLEHARLAAIRAARDLMCAELQNGTLCLDCHIEITSEVGTSTIVPFGETIAITGG